MEKIIIVKGNREMKISADDLRRYEQDGWKKWTPKKKPDEKKA